MVKTLLQLGPNDAGIQLTADEFASASYKPPFIYERVKGRLVVMSPAGSEHRFVSRPFRRVLGGYWSSHPAVIDDVDIEGWVSTSEDDDRIPDICVYLAGASSGEHVPRRVPDLIFEFVSANRSDQERDYIDKRAEYHSIGVKEYVIVDRFKHAVLVLTWGVDDFSDRWLRAGDTYTTPLLPGLIVALSEAFD
ncbi:MAG: Uma2 family endonuclease [Planctomycetia bacterium]|nr:Uma2 family endonuclease [Planctomycetia bacterium]